MLSTFLLLIYVCKITKMLICTWFCGKSKVNMSSLCMIDNDNFFVLNIFISPGINRLISYKLDHYMAKGARI